MYTANRGFIRHPLPDNNRDQWFDTDTPFLEGWWDDAVTREVPRIQVAMAVVLEKFANKLAAKIG
jgi:hypothetical protein